MNGILIVNKPVDWTSHDVVAKLRNALKIKRVGHGGTLDPMATGVLPIFAGRATRAAEFCENAEKEYIAGLRLGIVTDTQDITGNTLSEVIPQVSQRDLEAVLPQFIGSQKQIPPMYSAIKKNGKKLYELARKGIEVDRPPRDIFISAIELLGAKPRGTGIPCTAADCNEPFCTKEADSSVCDFILRIACSKGTYIRTICHDIGAALGTGAAMSSLERTRAGAFAIDNAHTLGEILKCISSGEISKLMIPADSLFKDYPAVTFDEAQTHKVRNGTSFETDLPDGKYRFYGPESEFLALGEVLACKTKIIKGFFEPSGA